MIALPHDSAHVVAQQLPRTDLSQQFRVAFVGGCRSVAFSDQ
jgi:hypothetical protein